jgi:hypothetical protein
VASNPLAFERRIVPHPTSHDRETCDRTAVVRRNVTVQAIEDVTRPDGIVAFACDLALLDDGELAVCILQTGKVADGAIENDGTRPAVVAALRDLLHGCGGAWSGPALDEIVTGGPATVLLAPEYALGSPDWAAVDEFVRAADRPLVLIAGFGMTPGAWLREWLASPGATRRLAGWHTGREVKAADRVYNGSWCWIHQPGRGTSCVATLKNFPEQRTEAADARLDRGRSIVHLAFADVDVFPFVCADLLKEPDGRGSTPRQRLASALSAGSAGRPALVTGSLLQHQPWDWNWQRAIGVVVADAAPTRTVLLAIANQAYGRPLPSEEEDRWRSLSGIYASRQSFPRGATPFPAGRSVEVGASAVGLVVRDCSPCVVGGAVLVSRTSPVTGLHLWRATSCLPVGEAGVEGAFGPHSVVAAYETHRLTRRHPGEGSWAPKVAAGLDMLRTHLEGRSLPAAADLLRSLLRGTEAEVEDIADKLHMSMPQIVEAIHALAFLCTFDGLVLHGRPGTDGQLRFRDHDAHVLVWKDRKEIGKSMIRILQGWMTKGGGHPPLLVVGSGFRGSALVEGPVLLDRRSDWSAPPRPPAGPPNSGGRTTRDFSQPQSVRSVTCVDLGRLEAIYLEEGLEEDAERVAEFLTYLLRNVPGRAA